MSGQDPSHSPIGGAHDPDRRQFLKAACSLAAGLTAGGLSGQEIADNQDRDKPQPGLPQIPFGPHSVSRLIAGGNPPAGGSHQTRLMDMHYQEYFTFDRTVEFLQRCHAQGVNTWQTNYSPRVRDVLTRFRSQGGSMQWICLCPPDEIADPKQFADVLALKPIGIAFHGENTDVLWREGKIDTVKESLRILRDAGVRVGLSTHNPAVVEYVEEKAWDIDFYMTCVYFKSRSRQELQDLMGEPPIGEVYLRSDPPKMCSVIQKVAKPCLAFKMLAAGRTCNKPEQVRDAFQFFFANVKPTDAVIVGMYPRYTDQIAENAGLTRTFG
jgi:hypothetical protein